MIGDFEMFRRQTIRLCWRILRWVLILGTASSLIASFLPSSNPINNKSSQPLPQQRRIQEVNRNTLSKRASAFTGHVTNVSEEVIRVTGGRRRHQLERMVLINNNNYSLPFIEIPKKIKEGMLEKPPSDEQKALFSIVAMKDQGIELTAEQEKLLNNFDVNKKKDTKKALSRIRRRNEQLYFVQLRRKGMIEALPSGGERIIATPFDPVRFPASLQKIPPEEWTGDFRLFLNLTFVPWAKTELCDKFYTTFAPPHSLKTSALASFPSSGNSWIRYLIESSSGIFSGSMYEDSSLTRKGMYGEQVIFDSGMTILQKTHGYTTGDNLALPHDERVKKNHMEELNNQGVLVIRNPFKALVSHRHLDAGGHTGYAPISHFKGEDWRKFVLLKTKLWKDFNMDWLNAARPGDLHVVFYEDIKSNPLEVLRKILKFLHLPIDNRRLKCISKHPEGAFKRRASKTHPAALDHFTREMKEILYEAIDDLNDSLTQHGKDPLPVHLYEFYDPSVAAVIRQRRRGNH